MLIASRVPSIRLLLLPSIRHFLLHRITSTFIEPLVRWGLKFIEGGADEVPDEILKNVEKPKTALHLERASADVFRDWDEEIVFAHSVCPTQGLTDQSHCSQLTRGAGCTESFERKRS